MKKDNSKRGGMMNLYGWRPGEPPKLSPDKPFYENSRSMIYNYLTTREAVEAVLPEPLEPGPNPFAAIVIVDDPAWFATDGVAHTFNGVIFFVECQYKGEVGLNIPYMYAGTSTGDFTDGAELTMALGRENRGFPKKLANIYINRVGDEWVATMARKGVRLVNFRAKFDKPMKPADVPTAKYKRLMLPREIISVDFMGYDLRQLIAMELDFLGNKSEITSCMKGTGSIELGHIDNDPLDTLKVVKPGIFVDLVQNIRIPVGSPPEILATNW